FYRALQKLRPPKTPLAEIMHAPVITARETDTLSTVLLTFLREPIKRVVVVAADDPQRPVGIVAPVDVLTGLADDQHSAPSVFLGAPLGRRRGDAGAKVAPPG